MKKRGVTMTFGSIALLCIISFLVGILVGAKKDSIIHFVSKFFNKVFSSKPQNKTTTSNSKASKPNITRDDIQAIRIIHELATGYKIVDQKLSKYK